MSFRWIPGTGPDEDALARMRAYLPRPTESMGEAWFMSKERRLHRELLALGAERVPVEVLQHALWDIASGTGCFGHLEEWDTWLRYLLPTVIERSHERYAFDSLLEHAITGFMAVFWTGVPEEYPNFQEDVLRTLGQAIMTSEWWAPDPLAPQSPKRRIPVFLTLEDRGEQLLYAWRCTEAPGSVAASMAFCLKYLSAEELRPWATSLFDIEHPHWRLALLVWYVGAQHLRTKPTPTPRDLERARPIHRVGDLSCPALGVG
jgi:hypothetical protein